jgi:hypothetical protein
MRGGIVGACVGLALLVSGCETLDGTYLREGVGTTVPITDIVATTNLQELYFGEVCRQAGLPFIRTADGALLCDNAAMAPPAWTLFVQAGMNDIDRRCDAYLAWLDDRRRWREPLLKQLHSTAAATAAIMGLSGVGATPIAIVGAAFGFAQETFVNLSGRLITEVNHSTVQSLVLTRQNDYRAGLRNTLIANGPAALYALRSYLRICMPMTIETEINTTLTGVDRNGVPPVPLITPATINAAGITDVNAPIRTFKRAPLRPPQEDVQLSQAEGRLNSQDIRNFETLACVKPLTGKLGARGSNTRLRLRAWLAKRGNSGGDAITADDRLLLLEAVRNHEKQDCT